MELLKTYIELAPQFIPQRIIDYDNQLPTIQQHLQYQQTQRQKRPLPSLAFGRKLEDLAKLEGITSDEFIPDFVIQIVEHIKENGNNKNVILGRLFITEFLKLVLGLDKEGIFRKSPSSEELQFVKTAFNNGN